MATTKQSTERFAIGKELASVKAFATFSADDDISDWTLFNGDVTLQAQGPVSAATVAIERSTVDPSGGEPNTVEVDDGTGSGGGGVTFTVTGVGNAWYRAKNKATFGPATSITERSLLSLEAAINGLQADANGFFPGTDPQPLVHASVGDTALKMNLTAVTAGVAGNAIATTETLADGSFGATTLLGGLDAVQAAGTLTFSALPTAAMTVTIDTTVYTFVAALGSGDYEVLRGVSLTTARDNLTAAINATGVQATGTLTANANPGAGATVRLGTYTYTFVTSLTTAPAPFQVKIGATASDTLDNFIAAVNGAAGASTLYNADTPPNPLATAAAGAGDTVTATSVGDGADANNILTTGTIADVKATSTLTFSPGTVTTQTIQLSGVYYIYAADPTTDASADGSVSHPWQVDVGATATISLANLAAAINATGVRGTTYSYALAPNQANAVAEATASTSTTVSARARAAGTGGNSISTTVPSGASFAWTSTVMAGGLTSLTWGAAQLSGATGPGVTYGDDIVAHPSVTATTSSTDAMIATAINPGVEGNSIATTDTLTDVKATGTLTFTPGTITTQTVKVGNVYYIFALDPTTDGSAAGSVSHPWQVNQAAVAATGTLTLTPGAITTQKIQIDGVYYIWAADPTTDGAADGTTTHPWQVFAGANDTAGLANMRSAINASGVAGVDYSTALTANPDTTATASDATTLSVAAKVAGAGGNSISTTVVSGSDIAWGGTTLSGGGTTAATALANLRKAINATGVAGTDYSTSLVANPLVSSTATTATTLTAEAILAGAIGNTYATTVPSGAGLAWGGTTLSGGGGSWAAGHLSGGVDPVAASGTLTMTDVPADTETVTIGSITYTFADEPADVDEVLVATTTIDVVLSGQQISNL